MRFSIIILFLFTISILSAQSELAENYIGKYKHIAIQEMERTGIPASITLAQGLLESNWGRSELAVKSNNHFGIKCSGKWDGKTHYRFDDDYDNLGRKRKSCFRVYEHAEASFIDHSDFLTDDKKHKRYGFLFQYSPDDYISWAHGLSKAGYATDPSYAKKLISIIEKYALYKFDIQQLPEDIYVVQSRSEDYRIDYNNSCKLVLAKGGETLGELAKHVGVSTRKLMKYNKDIDKKKSILETGQRIYLEPKKNYYIGDIHTHPISPGEDIASIANIYGIDSDYLKMINNIDDQTKLNAGDEIKLSRNRRIVKNPQSKTKVKSSSNKLLARIERNSDYLFDQALTPVKN